MPHATESSPVLRAMERLLIAVALATLGWCGWALLDAQAYQARQGQRLARALGALRAERAVVSPEGPWRAEATRAAAAENGLVGRLEIPRLGISEIVAEGIDDATLRRAVGHVPWTAFPGERGNVGLAAHRDSHFRPLRDVRNGDLVRLVTLDGAFLYEVVDTHIVEPSATEVLEAGHAPTLTLVTCYPFQYVGRAPQRFVVHARQLGPDADGAG